MKTKKRTARLDYNYLNGSYLLYIENAPGTFAWYLNGEKRSIYVKKRLDKLIDLMNEKRNKDKNFDLSKTEVTKIILSKGNESLKKLLDRIE